jgi:hypothetical protein
MQIFNWKEVALIFLMLVVIALVMLHLHGCEWQEGEANLGGSFAHGKGLVQIVGYDFGVGIV